MSEQSFDLDVIVETFARHLARFIVIGGLAARMHGAPIITKDVDICYARDRENLTRMAAALQDLGARLRGAPDDVPFLLDARTLELGDHFTFRTIAGDLDILGSPAGARGGLDELEANAVEVPIGRYTVRLAGVDDLIRMKLAAGRLKDRLMVEELGALRDEIQRRANEGS